MMCDGEASQPRAAPGAETPWHSVVERLAWGGLGVGRLGDGRIVLLRAPLALFPGEEVTAAIQIKSRHAEGRVLEWTRRDPRRMEPACPYAMRCGACDLWGAGDFAGELKRQMVADLLHRNLPQAPQWEWFPAPADVWRTRIQLHWDGARLGYHERGTHTIVETATCLMAAERLSRLIPLLREALGSGTLPGQPMRWELSVGTPKGEAGLELVAIQQPEGGREPDMAWGVWTQRDFELGAAPSRTGRGLPLPEVQHWLPGELYIVPAGSFFQNCPRWAHHAIVEAAKHWEFAGETLFDLYGGVGFLSAIFLDRFKQAVLIEQDEQAAEYARLNLNMWPVDVIASQVEQWITSGTVAQDITPADALILDPPRSGLPEVVVRALRGIRARTMLLLGCDGANFCRDVKRLAPAWRLEHLAVLDLFPNTAHVECLGLLKRESRQPEAE
jgi:23S rRNA (uracil1939-C5)-methyltransferase